MTASATSRTYRDAGDDQRRDECEQNRLPVLAARYARRFAKSALERFVGETLAPTSPLIRTPLRLVFIAMFVLLSGLLLFPALSLTGLRPRVGTTAYDASAWLVGPGLRILVIVCVAYVIVRATHLAVRRFERELRRGARLNSIEYTKRARTLGVVVDKVVTALIAAIAFVTILNEIGVNIAPLLTGAGIAGVGTRLRRAVAGEGRGQWLLLILEDQVRVGDDAVINGTAGLVEQINLRTIVLRDVRGTVHVFSNGDITTLANQSKEPRGHQSPVPHLSPSGLT